MGIKQVGKFNIDKIRKEFEVVKRNLPKQVGSIAVLHFKDSFKNEGFTDNNIDPWAKRKRKREGKKILVDSGDLLKSIKMRVSTFKKIVISTLGIDYAGYHNDGIPGRLPKREFMGDSKKMDKKILKKIKVEINKAIKKALKK